jgi:hypothetical protein
MRILSVVLAALAAIVLLGGSVITEWHNPAVPGATGYAALYEIDPNGVARGVTELGWYEGTDSTVLQLFPGEWQVAIHENGQWTFPVQGDADGVLILGDLHVTGRLYLDDGYLENVDGALIWCAMDICEE